MTVENEYPNSLPSWLQSIRSTFQTGSHSVDGSMMIREPWWTIYEQKVNTHTVSEIEIAVPLWCDRDDRSIRKLRIIIVFLDLLFLIPCTRLHRFYQVIQRESGPLSVMLIPGGLSVFSFRFQRTPWCCATATVHTNIRKVFMYNIRGAIWKLWSFGWKQRRGTRTFKKMSYCLSFENVWLRSVPHLLGVRVLWRHCISP